MKFNPITNNLYTNEGEFLKKLYCPYDISLDELKEVDKVHSLCAKCNHIVLDSAFLKEDKIKLIFKQNKKTCLKLDFNQENVDIIFEDFK